MADWWLIDFELFVVELVGCYNDFVVDDEWTKFVALCDSVRGGEMCAVVGGGGILQAAPNELGSIVGLVLLLLKLFYGWQMSTFHSLANKELWVLSQSVLSFRLLSAVVIAVCLRYLLLVS